MFLPEGFIRNNGGMFMELGSLIKVQVLWIKVVVLLIWSI